MYVYEPGEIAFHMSFAEYAPAIKDDYNACDEADNDKTVECKGTGRKESGTHSVLIG
jgi:hypothetical protein